MNLENPKPETLKRRWIHVVLRQVLFLLTMLLGMIVAIVLLAPLLPNAPPPNCARNMKDIALAVHCYAQAYHCFPPSCVADKNGKPMHSWRVLILPYLKQDDLYHEYDFSEPWNGPHNSRLMEKCPAVFHCPQAGHQDPSAAGYVAPDPSATNYVAVVGDATLWPESKSVRFQDIRDGVSNTIMFVEVADSDINWMEPRDLNFDRAIVGVNVDKRHGISGYHNGGAYFAFVDGSVKDLPDKMSLAMLRALLTIAGGEAIDQETLFGRPLSHR
jgi:prepilin-type processing-associated H-X9-DG protein